MLKVGLTGGIGCGKSTVSSVMAELGAYIFEADDEAKKMITENSTVQSELIAEFGTDIMGAGNVMDLQKLGRIALQDEDHQMRLNSVVHPYIYNLIDDQFNKISEKNKHSMFVVDAALIYESGYDQHLDYVIVITALMKNRMERTIARGTLTRQQILKRIDLQWSEEEKTGLADFVIHNDGTEEDLQKEIKEIYNRIV
ncbi:MAG TPA: dephospho-CoA kinase [Candidatus Marinimicrobia bacterium]|jgi:dephospho-CoA kinase|nr:dephospho-CoA kinase [Candidatus Neomarinimicrobiota bacterium]MDP6229107.1 dephospho-CoA kinase [Candidatus Neomarinimicrobiota bacterium]MDP7095250.1 dephospho-CoA kinase [Candidatus Neomarinimicrobiota bacterium]MDP7165715.1 dephospho-CoA kinase [Candidatus Neomarinimicrobiota bacterium]MDP7512827.1 dephospho-CoA kinase [Candidatus Neomarinimicrobiota bacterium]|tara:strand:- start:12 stop:605 length:594 start_codon:yes stop_codon:yes gene_type:complete